MKRLEVRCCCQPEKLRGWLEVPDHQARAGATIRFSLRVPFMTLDSSTWAWPTVCLTVTEFLEFKEDASFDRRLALKSEDIPLETLRMIRGFEEA